MNSIDDYKKRADELETKLSSDPTVFSDPSNVKKLSNELKTLKHRISLLDLHIDLKGKIERNRAALREETDFSLRELLKVEISEFEEKTKVIEKELEDMDNPDLQLDKSSCIVEIRAGTGGEEAALFASDLFKMYSAYIASKGWELALLSESFGSQGGMKEIIFEVNGEGAFGKLKNESGVHRVQRIPKTEAAGRIHTSAVSVVVLPQIDETEVEINPADIRVDVYRAGGPGGQGVNTTDSAVRLTHIPTNTVVTCQEGRSQIKNKEQAMGIMRSKLYELEREKKLNETGDIRKNAIKGGDRSDKIKTYNFPQSRLTDHRIKKSWFNLDQILSGDIDEILSEKII